MSVKHIPLANKIITTFILSLSLFFISGTASAFTNINTGAKDNITSHIGKNKWTIMEVWTSDCPSCRAHMPEMVKFDGKLKNARIVGVSLDGQRGKEDAQDFIDEFDIKFPTILSNAIEMNVWMQQNLGEPLVGTPTFILFDPEGKLVAAQPGIVATASLEKFIIQNSKPDQDEVEVVDVTTDTNQ